MDLNECGRKRLLVEGRCRSRRNDRGVALIIVLLATALLIALVVEFASGTRISMHSAVNFRDSQRAYYLARSGINFIGNFLSYNLNKDPSTGKDHKFEFLQQKEWFPVPFMPSPDIDLKVRWEDESSKINIAILSDNTGETYERLTTLFRNREVDTAVLDNIVEWQKQEIKHFYLLTELHQFMSDEEYNKIKDSLTVLQTAESQGNMIDLNTASVDVLQTIGLDADVAERIIERRSEQPFTSLGEVNAFLGTDLYARISGKSSVTSNVFRVYSYATVGGYTKQVEAVVKRSAQDFKVLYWRAL